MPSFHRTEGLNRVASRYVGQPALSGQQVEDLVAYLGTLK
jgi:sulfur-oxidizing protein SoxX